MRLDRPAIYGRRQVSFKTQSGVEDEKPDKVDSRSQPRTGVFINYDSRDSQRVRELAKVGQSVGQTFGADISPGLSDEFNRPAGRSRKFDHELSGAWGNKDRVAFEAGNQGVEFYGVRLEADVDRGARWSAALIPKPGDHPPRATTGMTDTAILY